MDKKIPIDKTGMSARKLLLLILLRLLHIFILGLRVVSFGHMVEIIKNVQIISHDYGKRCDEFLFFLTRQLFHSSLRPGCGRAIAILLRVNEHHGPTSTRVLRGAW